MKIEQKIIPYGGVTTSPEDWLCKDGDLAVCQNLINEEGGIKALGTAQTHRTFEGGGTCVYIHENDTYTHYLVIFDTGDVGYYDGLEGEECIYIGTLNGTYKSACALGNVLITLTDEEMHYYLWKDESYIDLGNKLPELDIEFTNIGYFDESGHVVDKSVINSGGPYEGDHGSRVKQRAYEVYVESPSQSIHDYVASPYPNGSDDNPVEVRTCKEDKSEDGGKDYPTLMTNRCFSALNRALSDTKEQGLFVMPKVVRAAWRLYDGTYAMFTSPVLMYNLGTMHPLALEGASSEQNIASRIYPYTIDYKLNFDDHDGLANFQAVWGDIIKGVTIFVGSDILDYDGSGSITEIRRTLTYDSSADDDEDIDTETSGAHYYADIPRPTNEDMTESVKNSSPFYKVLDTDLDELSDGYAMLVVHRLIESKSLTTVKRMKILLTYKVDSNEVRTDEGTTTSSYSETLTITIPNRATLDTVYDLIEEAFMDTLVIPHKMYMGQTREYTDSSDVVPYKLGIALVAKGGSVSLTSVAVNTIDGSSDEASNLYTLDVYGWNAKGAPLPSDRMPLKSLETQPSINDDYLHHVSLLPGVLSVYNSRLNMGNLQVRFTDYRVTPYNRGSLGSDMHVNMIYYYVRTNSGEVVVQSEDLLGVPCDLNYIYYPDTRCYRAVVCAMDSESKQVIYDLRMVASNVLNGAVFVTGMPHNTIRVNEDEDGYEFVYATDSGLSPYELGSYTPPADVGEGVEYVNNGVLTAKVDNPFNWDASGEASVGNGKVLALVANTTALSEGQFGSHPMYAFTDSEGVWALAIGTDGQMSAVQPVCRDTLTDPKSICQLDDSILFATERGIMDLHGGSSVCISDDLDGDVLDTTELPNFSDALSLLFGEEVAAMTASLPDGMTDFKAFCQGCRIAYDYVNQRIVVFNEEYYYSYVLSIKTKKWGLWASSYSEPLNSYPECLVVTREGAIVDLSSAGVDDDSADADSVSSCTGLIVTRPFKVNSPVLFKTLYQVYQRGRVRENHVSQVLYGSRDLISWQLIGSSQTVRLTEAGGTPYKYFILVVGTRLASDETLHAFTFTYRNKYTNRMR